MSPARVVIVGGGTAGWMAACLMAKAWPASDITLIESPDIGIIGVGEGSTPQLRQLFRTLGIAEADWMPRADATYKTGIAFKGWSDRPGYTRYFHPFASDIDVHTQGAFHFTNLARRRGDDVPAQPDRFFLNAALADRRLAPLPADSFPFDASYGYHFDATLVGTVLRDHAVAQGVRHVASRVMDVAVAETGDIAGLLLEGGRMVAADLFVDASGFRGLLIQEALGTPFRSFADNLFNDRAIAIPMPLVEGEDIPCHTTATALSAGWAWHIPLTSRSGNGYVYSSRHIDTDAAEVEFRTLLGPASDRALSRHLTMKVGRVERSWVGNCVAIGLSQGFIEPLEATALHLVQASVEGLVRAWPTQDRDGYNAAVARRIEGIRDYIVCHYRVNQRTDSAYWREAAAMDTLSDSLRRILHAWFSGGDVVAEIERQDIADIYAPMSWECLLAGYGTFPPDDRLRPAEDRVDLPRIDDLIARSCLNFPSHRAALAALAEG
jgi:2-polyprenyl-6-methoxyphenol hydroxylase-like FAD-dependent oxidoreductase